MRHVISLFAWLCLAGSVLAAVFAVFLLVTDGSGPTFSADESAAGQTVRLVRPTTLWAKPSTVVLSTVSCRAEELDGSRSALLPLGHAPDGKTTVTTSGHGTVRYLTRTSTVGFTVGSVTCTGANLVAIVTARDSGQIHRDAGVAFVFAAPVLLLLGLGIRRMDSRLDAGGPATSSWAAIA